LSDAPVHLNASPSVHPSVAQRFCEHSNPTVRLLGLQLAETLETAYDRLGRLDSEIGEIKANRDLSAEGKHRRIAETRKAARASPPGKAGLATSTTTSAPSPTPPSAWASSPRRRRRATGTS
jgi:hypothetical protein